MSTISLKLPSRRVAVAWVLVVVALGWAAPASSAPAAGTFDRFSLADDTPPIDCSQLTPKTEFFDQLPPYAAPVVQLRVLVVVEPKDVPTAREALKTARRGFERVAIDLRWRFKRMPVPDLGFETEPYLKWLKKQVGGERPKGFDVVYLATSHVLYSNGQADCIGGVADPKSAFAVGMLSWHGVLGVRVVGYELPQGPPVANGGAKLILHEIGHLLGGHHHYSPCGASPDVAEPAHPCDVMNPALVQQIGLHYGPINAAIVRHHALKYAQ